MDLKYFTDSSDIAKFLDKEQRATVIFQHRVGLYHIIFWELPTGINNHNQIDSVVMTKDSKVAWSKEQDRFIVVRKTDE